MKPLLWNWDWGQATESKRLSFVGQRSPKKCHIALLWCPCIATGLSSDTFRNRNHSYTDISGFSPRTWKISPETSECRGQYSWWQWHPLWIPQLYQIPKGGNFIGHNMWYVTFVFWDICWIPNSIFCFPISLVAPEYAELLYTHRRNEIRIYPTVNFSCNLLYL